MNVTDSGDIGKLHPAVKELWIAALRGGKYVRGSGALKKLRGGDGQVTHCPLGVLCEELLPQAVAADPATVWEPCPCGVGVGQPGRCDTFQLNGHYGTPPDVYVKLAYERPPDFLLSWTTHAPVYPTPAVYRISMLNDTLGFSYAAIADVIERSL